MNTYSSPVRVGVAGATGYAGQELVGLLPRLARIWDGQVEPLNKDRLASEMDLVFLAVPEAAAAELAPPLVEAGVRVIDLSGAFRIRTDTDRARWYPATK